VKTAPSILERVIGFLGSLWFWVILGLVLVAGAALHFARNRGTASSIAEDLAETGTRATLETPKAPTAAAAGALSATQKLRALKEEPGSIVVDERQTPDEPRPATVRPAVPEAESGDDEYHYPFEDTIAGETGINLDQSDSLTEADFHMAYGLYDQAAEIMTKAIEREPDRYDLRRKLLDICFVWGNADEFLTQARALKGMAGEEHAADWAKVAIMGSQICPGEGIFEAAGGAVSDVDVDLGEGDDAQASAEDEWLDFDVGASEVADMSPGDTQEQPALDEDVLEPPPVEAQLDEDEAPLDEDEATAEHTAELAIEDLGIDLDLGETGEHALKDLAERAPEFTDETGEYLADLASENEGTPVMATGEQASDDTEATMDVERPGLDEAWAGEESSELTPNQVMETPGDAEGDETGEVPLDDSLRLDDLTDDVDLEFDDEEVVNEDATQIAPSLGAADVDEDDATQEMPPVTMSVIGTKLDLARAYIDMGDPDGAKSILEEVLAEGDDAQKTEARELIESLG